LTVNDQAYNLMVKNSMSPLDSTTIINSF